MAECAGGVRVGALPCLPAGSTPAFHPPGVISPCAHIPEGALGSVCWSGRPRSGGVEQEGDVGTPTRCRHRPPAGSRTAHPWAARSQARGSAALTAGLPRRDLNHNELQEFPAAVSALGRLQEL